MRVKDYKCKCGHDEFFFADKGNQKGIYCSYCGKWLKWADKDEQNLRMKQESIFDKIRAEIEEKYGNCDICEYFEDYDYEENDISEYRPIGNIADVLQIIDKYVGKEQTNE